jgi:hypothetical protein
LTHGPGFDPESTVGTARRLMTRSRPWGGSQFEQYLSGMTRGSSTTVYDRVLQRRGAVALARHFREAEGLSIAEIADRLRRSPATVKAYFYDPTGEKAQAVKARYQGVCRGCGAYTQPRNGKGDAYAYRKACHPGAIERRWTRERVLAAMIEWRSRYGRLPTSYDWSRTHAGRRGGRRSSDSPKESGPRRAWSPASSALGLSLAPRLRGQTWRCRHAGRRRFRDWAVTRSHCLIPGNPPQNPMI